MLKLVLIRILFFNNRISTPLHFPASTIKASFRYGFITNESFICTKADDISFREILSFIKTDGMLKFYTKITDLMIKKIKNSINSFIFEEHETNDE